MTLSWANTEYHGMPTHDAAQPPCSVSINAHLGVGPCIERTTFGCDNASDALPIGDDSARFAVGGSYAWVNGGCRAALKCNGHNIGICGQKGVTTHTRCSCDANETTRRAINLELWRESKRAVRETEGAPAAGGALPACCRCAGPSRQLLWTHQQYIASLDLHVVSSGGVGSNALVQSLQSNGTVRVQTNQRLYEETCHPPRPFVKAPLVNATPVLFIFGDLLNAISSVVRQGYVRYNYEKLVFGTDSKCCHGLTNATCPTSHLTRLLELGHPDPFGIARQRAAFLAADTAGVPVAFVRYPPNRSTVSAALRSLGLGHIDVRSVLETAPPRRPHRGRPGALQAALHHRYALLAEAEHDTPAVFRGLDAPPSWRGAVRQAADAVDSTWRSLESGAG